MGGGLLVPAQSSRERTSARRETRGLLNRKTVFWNCKLFLMKSRGLGGGDEYLCRLGGRWRSRGDVGDVATCPQISAVIWTCKAASLYNSGLACLGCRSTQVMVSIDKGDGVDRHRWWCRSTQVMVSIDTGDGVDRHHLYRSILNNESKIGLMWTLAVAEYLFWDNHYLCLVILLLWSIISYHITLKRGWQLLYINWRQLK